MKYMIMMFGSAEGMMETADPAWIQEMIGFMIQIDKDLTESGEMVFNAGLADGSTAKLIKQTPPDASSPRTARTQSRRSPWWATGWLMWPARNVPWRSVQAS